MNPRAPAPKVVVDFPAPPKGLTTGEAAAWRSLAGIVKPMGVVTPADMIAFRQMAISLAVIDLARSELKEAGGSLTYSLETESGLVIRARPQVEIVAKFKKILAVELSRFGLTPADRDRVSALGTEADDPLDEFAQKGGGNAA